MSRTIKFNDDKRMDFIHIHVRQMFATLNLNLIAMKKPNSSQLSKYFANKKFAITGFLIVIVSIGAHFSFPPILKTIIENTINLQKDSEFYNWWTKPSSPTEVGFYFFHIENAIEVQNGAKRLKVKEMGKYMFNQYLHREIVDFSPNLETITFYEKRIYIFDKTQSVGSLDDSITAINAPFAALGSIIPKVIDELPFPPMFNWLPYRGVNRFLESHNQSLFINTTIRDLLYGYRLDILDTAEGFAKSLESYGISDIMPTQSFPNNSFGILNGRNGTRKGPFQMYTGLSGTHKLFGHFKTWNNQTLLNWWKSDTCNAINGTDGTIWPPFVDKKDRLYFFDPDVCRSIYVTFEEESEYKGIKTFKYSAPNEVLAGIDTNRDNECFCTSDADRDRCQLNGIYDLSECQNGVPIILTLPHFLGADPIITDSIEGLKPNPALHRPEIHVEPMLGAVIHGDSRLQMAIRVTKNEFIRGFENLDSELYVPLFWGYKKSAISDEFSSELKTRLFTPVIIIRYTIIMAIITGLFIFVMAFLCQNQVQSILLLDKTTTESNGEMDSTDSQSSILELELLMKESPETKL